jgi:hypothetical protein
MRRDSRGRFVSESQARMNTFESSSFGAANRKISPGPDYKYSATDSRWRNSYGELDFKSVVGELGPNATLDDLEGFYATQEKLNTPRRASTTPSKGWGFNPNAGTGGGPTPRGLPNMQSGPSFNYDPTKYTGPGVQRTPYGEPVAGPFSNRIDRPSFRNGRRGAGPMGGIPVSDGPTIGTGTQVNIGGRTVSATSVGGRNAPIVPYDPNHVNVKGAGGGATASQVKVDAGAGWKARAHSWVSDNAPKAEAWLGAKHNIGGQQLSRARIGATAGLAGLAGVQAINTVNRLKYQDYGGAMVNGSLAAGAGYAAYQVGFQKAAMRGVWDSAKNFALKHLAR